MTFWIIAVTDGKEYIFLTLTSFQGAYFCVSLIVKIKMVTVFPEQTLKSVYCKILHKLGFYCQFLKCKTWKTKLVTCLVQKLK